VQPSALPWRGREGRRGPPRWQHTDVASRASAWGQEDHRGHSMALDSARRQGCDRNPPHDGYGELLLYAEELWKKLYEMSSGLSAGAFRPLLNEGQEPGTYPTALSAMPRGCTRAR
jgi:hypothetical protein